MWLGSVSLVEETHCKSEYGSYILVRRSSSLSICFVFNSLHLVQLRVYRTANSLFPLIQCCLTLPKQCQSAILQWYNTNMFIHFYSDFDLSDDYWGLTVAPSKQRLRNNAVKKPRPYAGFAFLHWIKQHNDAPVVILYSIHVFRLCKRGLWVQIWSWLF